MTNKQIENIITNYDERLYTLCELHTNKLAGYGDYDYFYKSIRKAEDTVKHMIFGLYYYDMIDCEQFEEVMNKVARLTNDCL